MAQCSIPPLEPHKEFFKTGRNTIANPTMHSFALQGFDTADRLTHCCSVGSIRCGLPK